MQCMDHENNWTKDRPLRDPAHHRLGLVCICTTMHNELSQVTSFTIIIPGAHHTDYTNHTSHQSHWVTLYTRASRPSGKQPPRAHESRNWAEEPPTSHKILVLLRPALPIYKPPLLLAQTPPDASLSRISRSYLIISALGTTDV